MNKCHECDSEVSGQEPYCPFCGILLAPIVPVAAEEDDSLESTIMMPPDEIARLAAEAKEEARSVIEEPVQAEDASSLSMKDIEVEAEAHASQNDGGEAEIVAIVAKDNVDALEIPDVPPPAILTDTSNTSDNISVRQTQDHTRKDLLVNQTEETSLKQVTSDSLQALDLTEKALSEVPSTVEEIVGAAEQEEALRTSVEPEQNTLPESGTSIFEETAKADSEKTALEPVPEQNAFSESAGNEVPADDELVAVVVKEASQSDDVSRKETERQDGKMSVTVDEPSSDISDKADVNEPPTLISPTPIPVRSIDADEARLKEPSDMTESSPVVDVSAEAKDVVISSETEGADRADAYADEAAVEMQILRPVDDLEPHDPFAAGAIFDSVRIMENHEVPASEQPTRVGRESQQIASEQRSQAAEELIESQASPAVGSTAHNIGEGDTDGKRSAKLKPLSEGTVLNGRYEIVRKIGGGGMGAVYLASDNNLGGVLRAVKEMIQAHIEDEQQEKAISDFKRESMILSTLDHPSIPTIFDYFFDENENRFYLVMKYISGGDLASRLRAAPEGRIDERTVTEWAIQIADVLDYLHNQPSPIVYRDLKPSNIMVDGSTGRIMLIDFGIARSISQREEKGVTAVGTMGYAPPELFSGNVEPRSDIYSLGSTMFHLLTGADPQSNPLLIFDFQKNPRPRQINPQLSDQIERILMRSVEYTAQARFGSAAELKASLEDHLAALDSNALSFGVKEAPSAVGLADQTVFCGFCGQRIVATDLFCAFCGSKQPIAQDGVRSGSYSRAGVTAKLFVEGTGELSAPAFSLVKDENLVGRRDPMSNIFPEIDLSKYDPQTKISRRHARIWRNGPAFLVEDLGSSNGTILLTSGIDSMRLIPHKPQALSSGDRIKVGDTTLHFMVG